MRGGDDEVLDVVLVLEVHAHDADPAAALLAVGRDGQALDVARARDRDDHVLLGDEVLELELLLRRHDLRAALVAAPVDLLDLEQLLADEAVDLGLVAENRAQLARCAPAGRRTRPRFLALQPGEALEAEVEDRLRLDLGELELSPSGRRALVGVGRSADERDDRVEVVERDEIALEDVRALLRLAQLVLRPPGDDLALVVEVVADHLEQAERPRDAVDQRDGVVAERRLQRRVLAELVEDDLRDRVALQLDLDPHAALVQWSAPVGIGISVQDLVVDKVGDLLDHAGVAALLDPVGKLGDDDRRPAAAQLLDVGARRE